MALNWINISRILIILVSMKFPESQIFTGSNIIEILEILVYFMNHVDFEPEANSLGKYSAVIRDTDHIPRRFLVSVCQIFYSSTVHLLDARTGPGAVSIHQGYIRCVTHSAITPTGDNFGLVSIQKQTANGVNV